MGIERRQIGTLLEDMPDCSYLKSSERSFFERHWFLVQLKPGGFERAKLNLYRQGFDTFMPVLEVSQRKRGRPKLVHCPLFPGYLFVKVPPEKQNWRAINNTFGVARLVALSCGNPTAVPCDLMLGLQARTDSEGCLKEAEQLVAGERVRIVHGFFAEHLAEVESMLPGNRVTLLLNMMGMLVRTELERIHLEIL